MEQKTTIKNVNILDLRKTAKETFDKISSIKNVNVLLVSPETAGYLTGIPSMNLNTITEMPQKAEIQACMSHLTINAGYLSGISAPKFLLVMGRVIVEPDATAELLNAKLDRMVIMGSLTCPESVAGLMQSKVKLLMGKTMTYPQGAVLVANSLTLDDGFLQTLDDGVQLVVTGSLRIVDDVSDEWITRKIRSLNAYGSILCRQEHALAIKARLDKSQGMTVIPAGHRLVEGALTLDESTLQTLQSKSLFCMGDVVIADDVAPATLERSLERIATMGAILCPARLRDILKNKCDMLDNRVILYEGTLWYVDDDRQLVPDQFSYIDGVMTIVVRSNLEITEDVSPQSILDGVYRIHNLGNITCSPEQVPAIEARLGIREGDLEVRKADEVAPSDREPFIGNSNVMVL